MKKILIVVDMQNDFAHPDGALYVPGGETLTKPINRLIAVTDYEIIITTQDWHPENHYSFRENGGEWPRHCVADTWGAEITMAGFLGITEQANHYSVILKGTAAEDRNDYSGFSGRDRFMPEIGGIKEVVEYFGHSKDDDIIIEIVGLALDYCVKATAIDAAKLGFKTRVLLKYTKAVNINPDDGEKAIREMKAEGVEIIQ